MGFDFDTSKLTQASARKVTPHDNCVVLDLGAGNFPRDIEVRLPDDDGARQTALWDGGLDLAINDEVLCHEYAGLSAWRVASMGGNESGAGQVRVNKVWAEDLTSESLVTDASDNVAITTGTLTLPSDIIHLGDADTKISFMPDDVEITVGGLPMLKLTEAGQDLITLGPGSGDVDIDFNNQMFLQGSDGFLAIGHVAPLWQIHVKFASQVRFIAENTAVDGNVWFSMKNDAADWLMGNRGDTSDIFEIHDNSAGGANNSFTIEKGTRRIGLGGVTSPVAILHVDQFNNVAAIPVALFDQADVDEPFVKFIGEAAAATLTRSIVDEGDVTTATRVGWAKIEIDDIGNQVTDGDYFVPFYSLA